MTDYCGQRDVCAEAPGCGWHWAQRVCEVMTERDAARAELAAHARIVQAARAWHAARTSADWSDVAAVARADAELMAAVEAE